MKFASLGSGSEDNALLISSSADESEHQTLIMLDCGFAVKETERRLARLAVAPEQLRGIVVTHEHRDHVAASLPLPAVTGYRYGSAKERFRQCAIPAVTWTSTSVAMANVLS